ncbi:MAG: YidC/Oxa1 family membrane protein insertase [Trebonia sp.]
MSALFGVPVDAAYHVVLALTTVLTPVLGGLAAAAGVVLLTIAVRLLVMPLSFRALRGQAAQARLAPRLQALRRRYARQPERLQREMTALYTREGTSMLAGIWPILVQWPLFSVLYLLFRATTVAGGPNTLLAHDFLGDSLGSRWLSAAGAFSIHGAVFLGVFAVLAAVCWFSARLAQRMGTTSLTAAPAGSGAVGVLSKVLPYITVVIAAFAPLAAAIYLTTSAAWAVGEREVFRRRVTASH